VDGGLVLARLRAGGRVFAEPFFYQALGLLCVLAVLALACAW